MVAGAGIHMLIWNTIFQDVADISTLHQPQTKEAGMQ